VANKYAFNVFDHFLKPFPRFWNQYKILFFINHIEKIFGSFLQILNAHVQKKNIFKHIAKTKNISLPIYIIIWFPSSFKHWNPLWVLLIKVLIFCNLKSSNKVNKKVCAVYDCICKYLSFHEQSAKLQGLGNSWRTKLFFFIFLCFLL
jgi:hypothetical protein